MTDGSTFDDARTILPGWELLVPSVHRAVVTSSRSSAETHSGNSPRSRTVEGSEWPRIYEANAEQIEDPAWIFPGQRFVVPDQRAKEPPSGRA